MITRNYLTLKKKTVMKSDGIIEDTISRAKRLEDIRIKNELEAEIIKKHFLHMNQLKVQLKEHLDKVSTILFAFNPDKLKFNFQSDRETLYSYNNKREKKNKEK